MPKVSVIVPVYNVEPYIDRCVSALFNQTLKEIEIILVDDESPDNCPALCDEYARLDSRVRVVHKKNGGLGMACNSGLEIATGEYVAFCDSDDWVEPEMYTDMYEAAKQADADMIFSGLRQADQTGRITPMSQSCTLRVYNGRDELESLALDMIANGPASKVERRVPMSAKIVLYRREMIVNNSLSFESERKFITEDLLFNLDCLTHARTAIEVPATYYNYFVNTASLSRVVRTDRFEKIKTVYRELLHRYGFASGEYDIRCLRLLAGYARVAICQIGAADISFAKKMRMIRDICHDGVWQDFHERYPVQCMPRFHRLFQWCVRHNLCMPIIAIAKARK